MSYWVLNKNGSVMSRTTVQRITNLEKQTNEMKANIIEFDGQMRCRFKEDEDLENGGDEPNPEV